MPTLSFTPGLVKDRVFLITALDCHDRGSVI
jgi:hypothetical protein